MYYLGEGVAKDEQKAFYWTKKAAEAGVASAQYNLAMMFDKGAGTKQSSIRGIVNGMKKLPCRNMFWPRILWPGDTARGSVLSRIARRPRTGTGNLLKTVILLVSIISAECWPRGKGLNVMTKKPFSWWLQSAQHGFVLAQSRVGYCYAKGRGS